MSAKQYQDPEKIWKWKELVEVLSKQKEFDETRTPALKNYEGQILVGEVGIHFNDDFFKFDFDSMPLNTPEQIELSNLARSFRTIRITDPEMVVRAVAELRTGRLVTITKRVLSVKRLKKMPGLKFK